MSLLGAILLGSLANSAASAQAPGAEATDATVEAEPAEAAVDPRDQARALFAEGVAAMAQEDWALAASKFEDALLLHSAPTIEYNLASAYAEQGRIGEAGDVVASVIANPETDEELRGHAQDLDAHLAAQAGTLTIQVDGDDNEGATVSVDAYTLPRERVGVPRHETPGDHVVVLHRGDDSTEERSITITQGAPERVTFGPPLLGEGGGASDDGGLVTNPVFWVLVGAGAVVVIAAIIAGVAASGSDSVGGDYQPAVLRF